MKQRRFGVAEFCLGLISGITAGIVVGILLAPRSGFEMRGLIADRATGFRSSASGLMDQAKQSFEVAAAQIEKVVGLQERSLRKKLDEIKAQLEEYHLNEV